MLKKVSKKTPASLQRFRSLSVILPAGGGKTAAHARQRLVPAGARHTLLQTRTGEAVPLDGHLGQGDRAQHGGPCVS